MSIATRESSRIDEIVVTNGGNGSKHSIEVETPKIERVAYARGTQRIPDELLERHLAKMDAYVDSLLDRTNQYVEKAIEMSKKGPSKIDLELAEPIGPVFPRYPWWNLFVVGPFQGLGPPPNGPFLPHKIIQPNTAAFFWAFLWRNPAPVDWILGNPSAAQLMNAEPYNLWAEMVNLTAVTNGPDIFNPGVFAVNQVIDPQLLTFIPPVPQNGKPNLYEVNVTVDLTGPSQQPMAGFATWIRDLDTEPAFFGRPTIWPHWHYERPMRFMVYTP